MILYIINLVEGILMLELCDIHEFNIIIETIIPFRLLINASTPMCSSLLNLVIVMLIFCRILGFSNLLTLLINKEFLRIVGISHLLSFYLYSYGHSENG